MGARGGSDAAKLGHVLHRQDVMAEAEEARVMAMDKGQPASAVSAIIAKAKLSGLWIEKRENTNKNDPHDPSQLSDAQLARIIDEGEKWKRKGPV